MYGKQQNMLCDWKKADTADFSYDRILLLNGALAGISWLLIANGMMLRIYEL